MKLNIQYTVSLVLVLVLNTTCYTQNQLSLELTTLSGKWHIIQTDFPMWLSGKRTGPTFNYKLLDTEEPRLSDKVQFLKNGKEKSIKGVDYPVNTTNTEFVWRGKGLLHILKSKWGILCIDEKQNWAIIYFEKTLFTPKGYDVIGRNKLLSPLEEKEVASQLKKLGIEGLTTL